MGDTIDKNKLLSHLSKKLEDLRNERIMHLERGMDRFVEQCDAEITAYSEMKAAVIKGEFDATEEGSGS